MCAIHMLRRFESGLRPLPLPSPSIEAARGYTDPTVRVSIPTESSSPVFVQCSLHRIRTGLVRWNSDPR